MKKRVYIAHAFSGTLDEQAENRRKAIKWVVWAATTQNIAPEAMWIVLTGELPETPENRALGLEIDKALVAGCAEVWLVGTRVSGGMQIEADRARSLGIPVVDMTDPARPLPPGPQDPPCTWRTGCLLCPERHHCIRPRGHSGDRHEFAECPVGRATAETLRPSAPVAFRCAPMCNALVATGTTIDGRPVGHSDFCPLADPGPRAPAPTLPDLSKHFERLRSDDAHRVILDEARRLNDESEGK